MHGFACQLQVHRFYVLTTLFDDRSKEIVKVIIASDQFISIVSVRETKPLQAPPWPSARMSTRKVEVMREDVQAIE
jgi:hypothetical protein